MSQSAQVLRYSRRTKIPVIPYATPARPVIIPRASFTIGATESVVTRVVTNNEGNQIHLQRGQSSQGEYVDDHHYQGDGLSLDVPRWREHRYFVEERRSFESTQTRKNRRRMIEGRNLEDDFNQVYRGDDRRTRSPSVRVIPNTEMERMQRIRALELQKQELEEEQRRLRLDVIRYSPPTGSTT